MGHLGHLKEEYEDLVDRLEGGQVAFPPPDDPKKLDAWREILEILFTPEEAALAAKIPVRPSSLKKIASLLGTTPEELRPRLDTMADKGLVFDLVHPKTGKERWALAPPVVGFLEFSLMRMNDSIPKERIAKAIDAYAHGDESFAREVFKGETVIGRALVHENVLGEDQAPNVMDWDSATAIVESAYNIGVSHCYCRHMADHLGRKCDAPTEMCITLNIGADFVIRRGFGRKIDTVEALDLLAQSRDMGLVQIGDNIRNHVTYLCNCCGCCCGQLAAINDYGFKAVNPSNYEASPELESCKGCSKCSKACPIGAITMAPSRIEGQRKSKLVPKVDPEICIGCGVCANVCRRKAMQMVTRPIRPYVPASIMERTLRMAIERGHLAHFVFDQGMGRGHRFLNQALQTICNLPAAQKALANEQLKSRFVRFALGTVSDPTGTAGK